MSTTATHIGIDEEFKIDIRASFMNIPANTSFVFEGANSFRLKLILPEGFVQTGGTFSDFCGTELSASKPFISYTVIGKFTTNSGTGYFQLLRGHKKADSQSTFVEVSRINYNVDEGNPPTAGENNARIALTATPGYTPYLTISQLRSGMADTAGVVFITDLGRHGLFKYNSTSTAADDGAMTIVASGRRYERVYEGAVNVSWFGVVGDGNSDQSAAIQTMLNNIKYRNVFFPKSDAAYRIKSIKIPSNTTLSFEEGTIVEGLGNLGTTEKMMYMYDVDNIIIRGYGATFKDHRENYPSGQHRHIFSLEGVANVLIEGMTAANSGGDGFYIGAGSFRKVSENIRITNVTSDNNRRAGLSITTVKNLDIVNSTFTNTNGEGPQSGINIEANTTENRLEAIRVTNPRTANNKGPGMMVSPGALAGTDRIVDIVITGHIDDGSQYGFLATYVTGPLAGAITVENPIWKNTKLCGFVSRNWSSRACQVMLVNPTVINCNTNASTSPTAGAAFYVHREANDQGDTQIGNVNILYPKIMDTRTPTITRSGFSFRDWASNNNIINCTIIDPIRVGTTYPTNNMIVNVELEFSDRNKTLVHDFSQWNSVADFTYYKAFYTNQTSAGARKLTLGSVNVGFPEITVEVRAPYNISIFPGPEDNILPLSTVKGKAVGSNVVGSRLKLRKTLNNSWLISEMSGTWSVQQ